MIRLLIADDHEVVRAGLRRVVEGHADISVVAEAATGDEILAELESGPVDVLVLDISMPGPGFMKTMERIRDLPGAPPVLVLSVHAEEEWAVHALQAGAAGYLAKGRSTDELVEAVRRVHGGGRYITPSLAEQLAFRLGSEAQGPPHAVLSDREFQVLCLLGSGKRAKQVAADLGLSPKTISTYRGRILEKLKFDRTADLVRYVTEHGLEP